jgi:LuxR family maltose regulon positive regulatory protein
LALVRFWRSPSIGERRAREAIELAQAHGWEETAPAVTVAYIAVGNATLWHGQLAEANRWLDRAERVLQRGAQPTTARMAYTARGLLESARGRYEAATNAFRAAEGIDLRLAMRHTVATVAQALKLEMLVQAGETDVVQQALDEMDEDVRARGEVRVVHAKLRLARDDPEGAATALAPIFAGASPIDHPRWEIQALVLKASAEDALGDTGASSRTLECALDRAEPDGLLLPFLLHPVPELLERHSRLHTSHASLISEILNLLSGHAPTARPSDATPLQEPLSESELRVLRYLPTNLRGREIAAELFVSLNTIRAHLRNIYAKLGVHSRAEAVSRARELGLLAPTTLRH